MTPQDLAGARRPHQHQHWPPQARTTQPRPCPPKVIKKILNLEFVEMAELKADIWVDDTPGPDGGLETRTGHGKPPVTNKAVAGVL